MSNSIVIPLGKSRIGHLDLRYALRSIEKHVKNVKNIVIVGDAPSWIKNVDVIGCSDDPSPSKKEKNIWNKVRVACLNSTVTGDFMFSNDDIIFLKDIDATDYPYYYSDTTTNRWIKNTTAYKKTVNHTRKLLDIRGFSDNYFDCHCPIIYNKEKFLNSFGSIDFSVPYGYCIKTIYCAVNRIDGEYMQDLKMSKKYSLSEVRMKCDGRHVISFTDAPLKAGLLEYLEEKFPDKSIYEL